MVSSSSLSCPPTPSPLPPSSSSLQCPPTPSPLPPPSPPSPPPPPPPSPPSLSIIPNEEKGQVRKQQIFSSQLYQALARVNLPKLRPGQTIVREAADRVLAGMANRTSRWSQAILTEPSFKPGLLKPKLQKHKPQRISISAPPIARSVSRIVQRLKRKNTPHVQRKMKSLGRLIPGCRKQKEQVILKEAADYIPALEMQVQAMNELVNLLSASAFSSIPPPIPSSSSSSVGSNSTSPPSTVTISSPSSSTAASTSATPS